MCLNCVSKVFRPSPAKIDQVKPAKLSAPKRLLKLMWMDFVFHLLITACLPSQKDCAVCQAQGPTDGTLSTTSAFSIPHSGKPRLQLLKGVCCVLNCGKHFAGQNIHSFMSSCVSCACKSAFKKCHDTPAHKKKEFHLPCCCCRPEVAGSLVAQFQQQDCDLTIRLLKAD